jgi:hypothetical protein
MAPTGWTTYEYQGPSVTDARLQDLATGGDFTDEVHAVAAELLQHRQHDRELAAGDNGLPRRGRIPEHPAYARDGEQYAPSLAALLPCPFCGAASGLFVEGRPAGSRVQGVRCGSCGGLGPPSCDRSDRMVDHEAMVREATANWNRRIGFGPCDHPGDVATIRAALSRIEGRGKR